jgi:periplasmic protein TonB
MVADESDLLVMEDCGDFADFLFVQSPVLSAKKTWSVLTISLLIHSFFIGMLWICGKPALDARHRKPPEWIDARLVTIAGDSEEAEAGPGGSAREPAAENPSPAPPPPVAENPPLVPPPVVTEIKRTAPPPKLAKAPVRVEKPQRTVSRRDERTKPVTPAPGLNDGMESPSAGSSQPVVQSGAGEGAGEQAAGLGKGGHGGSGLVEKEFGSPEGPSFLRKAVPSYPVLAKRMEREGSVLLRVTIDELGRPVDVEVVHKAGFGFDEEAVKAVKNSTFVPAKREGRPLTCKALLPIRFVLSGS